MLKSQKIEIEINRGNLPYYSKIVSGIKIGDCLELDLEMIPKGSNILISATCDICNNDVKIKYILYTKRFDNKGSFTCSKKCAAIRTKKELLEKYGVSNIAHVPEVKEKIKNTNIDKYGSESYIGSETGRKKSKETILNKYGVENPMKSENIKEKVKNTNIERWGCEWTLSNNNIREKIKSTNLERWGTETPSKNDSVKEKIISTNIERWGGRSAMCNEEIKEKSKNTLMENYGVDIPIKSDEIKNRIKNTNLERLGVEYPTQSNIVMSKIKESNLEKWGTTHISQSDTFRMTNTIIGSDPGYIMYKGESISIFMCDQGHEFQIKTDNYFSRKKQGIPLCTVCHPISTTISISESQLFEFIKSIYDGEIKTSYRDKYEIDVYLPEIGIGFEYNGLYWHSEECKEKRYHLDKTEHFESKGIRIIHIWEDDWNTKTDIIKSQITNTIGISNKIFARKTDVRIISDIKIVRNFMNQNHLLGYVSSVFKIGLYFNDELISVMTFDNFEGRKKMEDGGWNLNRFCTKKGLVVVGGASKLLSYFIKELSPKRIISYSDRDWSIGTLYFKLGFELISKSNPDYKYIIDGIRVHKSNMKKSKRKYDSTENEYTKSKNILRIWDCGKYKFEIKKSQS